MGILHIPLLGKKIKISKNQGWEENQIAGNFIHPWFVFREGCSGAGGDTGRGREGPGLQGQPQMARTGTSV